MELILKDAVDSGSSKEEIGEKVDALFAVIDLFGSLWIRLWNAGEKECVYMTTFDGFPAEGDRVLCKDLPRLVKDWLVDVCTACSEDTDHDFEWGHEGEEGFFSRKAFALKINSYECDDPFAIVALDTKEKEIMAFNVAPDKASQDDDGEMMEPKEKSPKQPTQSKSARKGGRKPGKKN